MHMYLCIYIYRHIYEHECINIHTFTHITTGSRQKHEKHDSVVRIVRIERGHSFGEHDIATPELSHYTSTVRCSVLQCIAPCCTVLPCGVLVLRLLNSASPLLRSGAVCCCVLQCVAVTLRLLNWVSAHLRCGAVCCSVLQCVAVMLRHPHCVSTHLQCIAVCCSVMKCVAVCCIVCYSYVATPEFSQHTSTEHLCLVSAFVPVCVSMSMSVPVPVPIPVSLSLSLSASVSVLFSKFL